MKLSSNLIRFHNELGLKNTIDIFSDAGFEGIDFNCDLEEYYTDAHDEAFYRNIKKYAEEKGIVFAQTHAPFGSSFLDAEKTKMRFEQIVKSMKHSSWLGADMIVIHPCKHIDYKENNNYDLMMEYNLEFYKKLVSCNIVINKIDIDFLCVGKNGRCWCRTDSCGFSVYRLKNKVLFRLD